MCWHSNGLGHQGDESEFEEAAPHGITPVVETVDPHEMEDQVPLGDDGAQQMALVDDDGVKPTDDDATDIAIETKPATAEKSAEQMTSEQERATETEEVEQEVEGKCSWYFRHISAIIIRSLM